MKIVTTLLFLFISLQVLAINKSTGFTENKGQLNFKTNFNQLPVDYYLKSSNVNLYFTKHGIIYQLISNKNKSAIPTFSGAKNIQPQSSQEYSSFVFEMKFSNSNPNAQWEVKEPSTSYTNFYLPTCINGLTNIKNYKTIVLRNIYPNIDWEISTNSTGIKYNFIVHPGGNPKNILMDYNYADKISIDKNDLKIETQLGTIIELAPICFQSDKNKINCNFSLKNKSIQFDLAAFDLQQDLIIDPGVVWSTYFGGAQSDYSISIKSDFANNIIIAGTTFSLNQIFNGGFQANLLGGLDCFLSKFDSGGNLIWSTYFGGSGSEQAYGCDVDQIGNIFLAFQTDSDTGLAYHAFQSNHVMFGGNAFLAKFNPQGLRIWATYFGAGEESPMGGVSVDHSFNAYLYTSSVSPGLGTNGVYQPDLAGGRDGLLAKFDSSGNRIWCTYFGLFGQDEINDVRLDKNENVFLSGLTSSSGLGHLGFKDTLSGFDDNFLAKFDSSGHRIWCTYYGGSDQEGYGKCALDSNQNIYLISNTSSPDQISYNGFQNIYHANSNSSVGYIVKFDSTGNRIWGTYYGANHSVVILNCSVTQTNTLLVCGKTDSDSGFAYLGYQNYGGDYDAFVSEFDENGNRLWANYFGGNNYDEAFDCTSDQMGNIYLTGQTGSQSMISLNGFQDSIGGNGDAFLTKFNCTASSISPTINGDLNPDTFGQYLYSIDSAGVFGTYWEVTGGQLISGQGTDSIYVHWDSVGTGTVVVYAMYSPGCYTNAILNPLINSISKTNLTSLQFYPNPFNDRIYFSDEKIYQLRLTDVLGRTTIYFPKENWIDTSLLPSGIYFIVGVTNTGKEIGRGKVVHMEGW